MNLKSYNNSGFFSHYCIGTELEWRAFLDYVKLTGYNFAYAPSWDLGEEKIKIKVDIYPEEVEAVTSFLELYKEE